MKVVSGGRSENMLPVPGYCMVQCRLAKGVSKQNAGSIPQ
jgi:hypothetical protein